MKCRCHILLLVALTAACATNGQPAKLRSLSHGLDMMLKEVPKEQLIGEMQFEDGENHEIDVIRFDHVGPNLHPLIISSVLPVATDSLGIFSFKLKKDSLSRFLFMIHHVNAKVETRRFDGILIRVTYRYNKALYQYYITNPKITTGFFRIIEKKLQDNLEPEPLNKFYEFTSRTGLWKGVDGKRVWKY